MNIQHNMSALTANNFLNKNITGVKKSSEKLSSGFRINRAGDDASGLAVSEKLRSQLRGIKQASRNCQDGVNLVQTFEGALGQTHEIINRCKALAAEAANGTYDNPTDRAAIELEYQKLCKEIDSLSDTDFNGLCMLNGGIIQDARETGLFWADPTDLKWKEGTFENYTNDPDFQMTISPLPALDSFTVVDGEERIVMEEFNGAQIQVDLDSDGNVVFTFKPPEPKSIVIETHGQMGVIYTSAASGSQPIAEVRISGVDMKVETSGAGYWTSTKSKVEFTYPKSKSEPSNTLDHNKDSDAFNPDKSDFANNDEHQARRAEYRDWVLSIPGESKVSFRISDDRKHFTIIGDASYFSLTNGKDFSSSTKCDNETEYEIGTTFFMKTTGTIVPDGETKPYSWDDAKVKINWESDSARPGATFALDKIDCQSNSFSGYSGYRSVLRSDAVKPTDTEGASYSLSISNFGSRDCSDISNENKFGGSTDSHISWLEHGEYTFNVKYKANGSWSITVSNDNGQSKTYSESDPEFTAILSKFGMTKAGNLDPVAKKINNAHNSTPTGFPPDNAADLTENGKNVRFAVQPSGTYSFSLTFSAPKPDKTFNSSWTYSSASSALRLGKYNPDNPDAGGVDYDAAVPGTYKYVNPDKVNTLQPGYWVNAATNEVIDPEKVGIHIPKSFDYDTLPSAKYDKDHNPLHDGMTVIIKKDIESMPEGYALATVDLWLGSGEGGFKVILDNNLADHGMSFSQNLIIQSNSRSKDSVLFTFTYTASGQGCLLCDTNCSSEGLGIKELTLTDQENSNEAMDKLDEALNKVSMVRATFGSVQNRLEKKLENLGETKVNIAASESHIRDTDMAKEMIKYTKTSIVQQASMSVLAQANVQAQGILQLVGAK